MEKEANKPAAAKEIKIKLIHSAICTTPKQRKTLRALGLTKINQVKTMPDNVCIRGMIKVVAHLVQVEE
ncbi:MAG: 50S ribosomal protein L30 [Clostridia bacterium]|nr:50S ribosomal protein L30 [Clostridia bacterium]